MRNICKIHAIRAKCRGDKHLKQNAREMRHQNQVSISIVSQDMTKSIFFENEWRPFGILSIFFSHKGATLAPDGFGIRRFNLTQNHQKTSVISQNRVWWISTRLWPLKTSKCEINILIHSILWKRPYQHIPWPLKPIFWHQNQVLYINCEPRYDQKYIFRKRIAAILNFVNKKISSREPPVLPMVLGSGGST